MKITTDGLLALGAQPGCEALRTFAARWPSGVALTPESLAAAQAAGLYVQARQALLKGLPDLLNRQMKKARNALLDMKVKGGDLTKPVGLLKQASIHMKREEYADAVRFVRMFQDEIGGA